VLSSGGQVRQVRGQIKKCPPLDGRAGEDLGKSGVDPQHRSVLWNVVILLSPQNEMQ